MSFALRNIVGRQLRPTKTQIFQKANYEAIPGPPQLPGGTTEKWVLGTISFLFINVPNFVLLYWMKPVCSKKTGVLLPE